MLSGWECGSTSQDEEVVWWNFYDIISRYPLSVIIPAFYSICVYSLDLLFFSGWLRYFLF